jgi:hypothetical protein
MVGRVHLSFAVAGNLNLDQYLLVERIPGPDEAVEVLETFFEPGVLPRTWLWPWLGLARR